MVPEAVAGDTDFARLQEVLNTMSKAAFKRDDESKLSANSPSAFLRAACPRRTS